MNLLQYLKNYMIKLINLIIFTKIFFEAYCQPTLSDSCLIYNDTSSTCVKCQQGYILVYFVCLPCNPFCRCSSLDNYCESCMNLETLNGLYAVQSYRTNQRCKLCNQTISNCISCQAARNQLGANCTKCNNGTYVINGQCSNSSTPCLQNCDICSNAAACQLCQPGYYLNKDNTCSSSQCSSNCLTCSSQNVCEYCLQSYYLQSSINSCVACMNNCQICKDALTCDTCFPSYNFVSGQCSNNQQSNCIAYASNFTICLICQLGYYNAQGTCTQCNGCLLCSTAFICLTECQQGYYSYNYNCLSLGQDKIAICLVILLTFIFMLVS